MRNDADVHIIGRGKVGSAIASHLRAKRIVVRASSFRKGLPERINSKIAILALRDGALADAIEEAAQKNLFGSSTVVLHVAGAFGPEVLLPLKPAVKGVGCMHPMIAFAGRKAPSLRGGHALVDGDREGMRAARQVASWLGLCARRFSRIERGTYHAAGALMAGGAIALADAASKILVASGVPERLTPRILGPLLRSVAENLEEYGTCMALTGAIRRGDARVVGSHLEAIRNHAPSLLTTWTGLSMLQVSLAEAIGEASKENLEAIVEVVQQHHPTRL